MMLRSLKQDESGIAMGLAIILIVLVGVMGAGLLVFVQRDLEAVVETNRGQDAFEAADAGVQAAERQLLSDNCPESYGGPQEEGDDGCVPQGESVEWHDDEGKTLELGEDDNQRNIKVQITYLPFPGEEDTICENEDVDNTSCAPEESEGEKDERRFFRVVSEGESASGNARRKIESTLYTYDLGVPKAYYSPESITIRGGATVEGVSLFSLGNVEIKGDAGVTGNDELYEDWKKPPFNETARPNDGSSGNHLKAGIGAVGNVTGGTEGRDFDGSTDPTFVQDPGESQSGNEITFPFEHENQSGEQDQARIDFLRDEAQRQEAESGDNHYVELDSSGDLDEWPENSTKNTVVFVEFSDNESGGNKELDWAVGDDCDDPPVKGTLVVNNGNFDLTQHTTPLQGPVIVRGGEYEEGNSDDTGGNTCIEGFVNASGEITIRGSVEPTVSEEVNRPGFYGVETWSWRERYE